MVRQRYRPYTALSAARAMSSLLRRAGFPMATRPDPYRWSEGLRVRGADKETAQLDYYLPLSNEQARARQFDAMTRAMIELAKHGYLLDPDGKLYVRAYVYDTLKRKLILRGGRR